MVYICIMFQTIQWKQSTLFPSVLVSVYVAVTRKLCSFFFVSLDIVPNSW